MYIYNVKLCNIPFFTSFLEPLHGFASNFVWMLCNMYIYNVKLCNIPFFTSFLEPLHGFASNFVWMLLVWIPTKFVKIGVIPLFWMELWVILCNFLPILKTSSSIYEITDQKSFIFGLESPHGV